MRTRRPLPLVAALVALVLLGAGRGGAQVEPPRQISVDPFSGGPGQHETAVEPDSFAFGDTVVSVFQVGRIVDGGASGIGWATSVDGGATWTSGLLPELTTLQSPLGTASRVSDPVVAFDRVHGVWLASVLALRDASPLPTTSLVVSRSGDGRSWSGPVLTARDEGRFAHDKNWIVCDNGRASRFAGTCYVAWSAAGVGLAISRSVDGGVSWSAPALEPDAPGYGYVPVVRPDGTLVVIYTTQREIMAVRSGDGGRTFAAPRFVTALLTSPVPGMRAPALPTAEVDAVGRITVTWQDCRFRSGCPAASTPNDIVWSSSADGLRWSPTRRVPTAPALERLHHFVPGLGVDATTSGATARLAVAFTVLTPRGCAAGACLVQPYVVSTANGGRTWSEPHALGAAQPQTAFPQSAAGRFLGDYISTSFVTGGVAVPVFAAAASPVDGGFRQGVFSTRVSGLASRGPVVRIGAMRVSPARPRRGMRLVVSAPLAVATSGRLDTECRAAGARVRLTLLRDAIARGRAVCTWVIRAGPRGARVRGTITVTSPEIEVSRPFTVRLG